MGYALAKTNQPKRITTHMPCVLLSCRIRIPVFPITLSRILIIYIVLWPMINVPRVCDSTCRGEDERLMGDNEISLSSGVVLGNRISTNTQTY